jgi:diguanylate cyclase
VLFEAARQCRAWRVHHPELSVSVNVSVRQLQDPDFVDDVHHALVQSELAAEALVLEVTESALAVDMVRIGMVMERVRELGVHLALDDFGTGYSSLLRLKGLPIDRLKIDRSFVSGLGSAGHDPTVITTVVDLAHKLGLAVVAVGVETEEELRAVSAMGCDEVQGFLLARPGPAGDFDPRPHASGLAPGPAVRWSGPGRSPAPVEAGERAGLGRVQGYELVEQLIVETAVAGLGPVDGFHPHQRSDLVDPHVAEGQAGQ